VRNINETFTAVTPSAVVMPACPPPSAVPAPGTVVLAARPAVAATLWSAVAARPRSGVEATGAGYAAGEVGIATRRGLDRDALSGKRFIGTNGTQNKQQQDQLHLMSRRDPRTWRPPA
jgi:hypothetical protein